MAGLFIVATNTDTGKTIITAAIASLLLDEKISLTIMKPIQTGAILDDNNKKLISEDLSTISKLTGLDFNDNYYSNRAPYLFSTPCSPHLAALKDNREIGENVIANNYGILENEYSNVIVESAGGLLSPISYSRTNRDIITTLNIPTILISSNTLGTISQTIATLEAMKSKGINPIAIILNDTQMPNNKLDNDILDENYNYILKYSQVPVFRVSYYCNIKKDFSLIMTDLVHIIPIIRESFNVN